MRKYFLILILLFCLSSCSFKPTIEEEGFDKAISIFELEIKKHNNDPSNTKIDLDEIEKYTASYVLVQNSNGEIVIYYYVTAHRSNDVLTQYSVYYDIDNAIDRTYSQEAAETAYKNAYSDVRLGFKSGETGTLTKSTKKTSFLKSCSMFD